MSGSVEQVFWRLVGDGLHAGQIGEHPDYQAAWAREHPAGHDCPQCPAGGVAVPPRDEVQP